eukprot:COSAG05_NODE_303_length_11737_cov_116.354270_10_plen_141_part_00
MRARWRLDFTCIFLSVLYSKCLVPTKPPAAENLKARQHLLQAGTFYYSCGVGSAALCASNTSIVQAATMNNGCSGDQAWAHCGAMFGQKIKVVVSDGPKPSSSADHFLSSRVVAVVAAAATAAILCCEQRNHSIAHRQMR